MAKVFVSYTSTDKAFAERVAADLQRSGAEVWIDEWQIQVGDDIRSSIDRGITTCNYFLIILSEAALKSRWVERELSAAFDRELGRYGTTILPVRIDRAMFPPLIAGKKYADFSSEYEVGLQGLLNVLRSASVRTLARASDMHIVIGRRGAPGGPNVRNRIGSVMRGGDEWCFAAVVESVGDDNLAPELTAAIGQTMNSFLAQEKEVSPEFLRRYIGLANSMAIHFRLDNGLVGSDPLSAKMAAFVRIRDRVSVATVGDCSALVRYKREDGGNAYQRWQSEVKSSMYPMDPVRCGPSAFVAPLGFIIEDDDHQFDLQICEAPFCCEGDLAALVSFSLARNHSQFNDLARDLHRASTAEEWAGRLAEEQLPKSVDSVCTVVAKTHPSGALIL